tara:strand:- start:3439 stop:5196 length:1758 start_codon:yes stop_codon:yes gene_type:complete
MSSLRLPEALVRLAEPRKGILEAIDVIKNKSNLETIRVCAAQNRLSVLEDPPPILFHESRLNAGNYLYSKTVYPVPGSPFRSSEYVIPSNAVLFACGMLKVTSSEQRPAAVLLIDKQTPNPALVLYVPDAPLAAMEAELFRGDKVSMFEREIFGDEANTKVKQRVDVGRHIRDCGIRAVQSLLFGADLWIEREGVLPFLRLSRPTTADDARALKQLTNSMQKMTPWNDSGIVDEEWMEQTRLQSGFEFKSVFVQGPVEVGWACENHPSASCKGSIARLASLILRGALDLAVFDPEKSRTGVDDAIPDRLFQDAMRNLAEEEDAEVDAELPQLPQPAQPSRPSASLSKLLADTCAVASVKTLKISKDQCEWIAAFANEYCENFEGIVSSGHFWTDVKNLCKKFDKRLAILVLLKDADDGILSDARLAGLEFTTDVRIMEDVVRLLHFPWVLPIAIEGATVTTICLRGVEREKLIMAKNNVAPQLPTDISDALREVPGVVEALKRALETIKSAQPSIVEGATAPEPAVSSQSTGTSNKMEPTLKSLRDIKRCLEQHREVRKCARATTDEVRECESGLQDRTDRTEGD